MPRRPADWLPLFNGRDLTGWRATENPASFTVRDGAIRANAVGKSSHLLYVGDRADGFEAFTDFELELTARAEPDSNGGVFVHASFEQIPGRATLARGYEVQLNSAAREKAKTGSLYGVVTLDKSPVDETKWFAVRVVVRGKRVTVALDGNEVLDYTEPADLRRKDRPGRKFWPDGGAIALQAHDPKSVWFYKDIRLKRTG